MADIPLKKRLKAAAKAFKGTTRLPPQIDVASASELVAASFWIGTEQPVLNVPQSLLRMAGGYAYGSGNPMVQAMEQGIHALASFYEVVQPETLSEFYGPEYAAGETGANLPAYLLPWSISPDEATKAPYRVMGPASKETIEREYSRLTTIADSLDRVGYRPDRFGHIRGYVLRSNRGACFVVTGGKHRAAVLTQRQHDTIPVMFHPRYPRLLDTAQCDIWPRVASGTISPKLATRIAAVYMAGRQFPEAAPSPADK